MYQATYSLLFSLLEASSGLDHFISRKYDQTFRSYQECYSEMNTIGKAIVTELDSGGVRAVFEFACKIM
jgi:hypothetical protein